MELTWTKVLAGAFVLSSGVAAGVWELRGDRIEELESKVSSYEAAEKWQLPQLLTSINSANDSIKTNLQRLSDYESAKKRVEELEDAVIVGEKKISELQSSVETHKRELETIKSTLAEKQKFIDELYPHNTTFTLDEGTRKSLVGSKLILGLNGVNSSDVEVVFNNSRRYMKPGEYIEADAYDSSCKLVLDDIHWSGSPERATFTFFCVKQHEGRS